MIDYVFILAGGSGTRLWPASTAAKPKQFFSLYGKECLLHVSLKRAEALKPSAGIVIITLEDQIQALTPALQDYGKSSVPLFVLPEPCARNTAPALATSAFWALNRSGGEPPVILVMTADHLIEPLHLFTADAEKAAVLAEKGYLVTFGIDPTRPETGYGYIELGEPLEPGYHVASFREKPDEKTAESFVETGRFLWNSGMFCFTAHRFMEELETHAPEVRQPLMSLTDQKPEDTQEKGYTFIMTGEKVRRIYETLPSVSIDYAVMEHSDRAAVVKAAFSWNDVGSWDVVAELLQNRETRGPVFAARAENNFVYADLPVALCGVEDLIVVAQNGVVLVCRKGESQQVKTVLREVEKKGYKDLL
ncbi:MAG: mannose-1-phosphate guanylyltransferase [Spirochaetales bacterium]|nr:mannose-1-phosphate guanylyltransferase [Spirochaetales bacterium]